ncbi:ribonuclease P/MRP protein subunit POP5 [Natronoarchaeum philippinense]|uniref:Ribonuclease P protein component 2 n=1 Tax=Natronoarchaeum philippinense TaxID=558529 RepID=A0A285N016_NATPI|nr:Rpp14/Pop5 family protein [Natronoarchaeum philippinense]SNZ02795.1 ribonuclease P/MRP protein subunit POP5 [Natronoarchaeum philippinense]
MKHLPKHLRPRWRYLAVGLEGWPDADIDRGDFQRELWYAAQNLIGDAGSADADLTVLDFAFDGGTGETIVRARHGHATEARAALACLDEIDGHEIAVRIRGVSGTIRACEEKYLGRAPELSQERNVVFEGEERPAVARDDRIDVRVGSSFVGATELDFK